MVRMLEEALPELPPRREWPPKGRTFDPLSAGARICPTCGHIVFDAWGLPEWPGPEWKRLPLTDRDLRMHVTTKIGLKCPNGCQAGEWDQADRARLRP